MTQGWVLVGIDNAEEQKVRAHWVNMPVRVALEVWVPESIDEPSAAVALEVRRPPDWLEDRVREVPDREALDQEWQGIAEVLRRRAGVAPKRPQGGYSAVGLHALDAPPPRPKQPHTTEGKTPRRPPGTQAAPPPGALTQRALRTLPLDALTQATVAHVRVARDCDLTLSDAVRLQGQRRTRITDDRLQSVARVWRSARSRGEAPTATVADRWGIQQRTAERWVSRAREAGHLTPEDRAPQTPKHDDTEMTIERETDQ